MNFLEELNDIFNQRRSGLSGNRQRALYYSKQNIVEAFHSLRSMGRNNNILIQANIIHDNDDLPIEVLSMRFYLELDNIINILRGDRESNLDEETDILDDLQENMNASYNRLVLEGGRDNGLCINVTADIINNTLNEEIIPIEIEDNEINSNNISQYIEEDNLASINQEYESEQLSEYPRHYSEYTEIVGVFNENNNIDEMYNNIDT